MLHIYTLMYADLNNAQYLNENTTTIDYLNTNTIKGI